MSTEHEFYIYKGLPTDGKPLDYREAIRAYRDEPVAFAEWELRRAKTWANLIAENYQEACRLSPSEDGQTQQSRHSGAVNYVKACQQRYDRVAYSARRGSKKKILITADKNGAPPRQQTYKDQMQ